MTNTYEGINNGLTPEEIQELNQLIEEYGTDMFMPLKKVQRLCSLRIKAKAANISILDNGFDIATDGYQEP